MEILIALIPLIFAIVFLGIIFVIVLFAIQFFTKKDSDETSQYLPYLKKTYLMTKAEHEFYKVLDQAVAGKYHIIPQVPLSNIVQVNKYEKHLQTYRNKIDRKCLDFVLFDKEYFTPHLVIELDDSSHELPDRQTRDHFVDAVLNKAGIKIEHIKTAHSYDLEAIV